MTAPDTSWPQAVAAKTISNNSITQFEGGFMFKRSRRIRALQIAGSVALCTIACASQADPVSLEGVCHLSSTVGGARCDLYFQVSDNFASPTSVRKSQVKIDGILVAQYVNDTANPVDFSVGTVSGSVTVACGVGHVVTAYVAEVGVATPYVKVGTLPSVVCPALP